MNQNYKEILNRIMEYKTEGARVLIAGVLVKMVLFLSNSTLSLLAYSTLAPFS